MERQWQAAWASAACRKENNFPPLACFPPLEPCLCQDFSNEIPREYQVVVKRIYQLWMCEPLVGRPNLEGTGSPTEGRSSVVPA